MQMIVERKEIMNIMNDTGKGATALRASLGFPLYVKPRSLRGPSQSLVRNSRGNSKNNCAKPGGLGRPNRPSSGTATRRGRTTAMKVVKTLTIIIAVIAVLAGAITWFFGPSLGVVLLGRPILMVSTPHRYGQAAIDIGRSFAIYADTPQATAAYEEAKTEIANVHSVEETYPIIKKYLKVAGGKHSNFLSPEDNATSDDLGNDSPTITKNDNIVTAMLPSLNLGPVGQKYADILANGLAENVPNSCGVILDLRKNDGGDMGPMLAGVSGLLPDGTLLSFKSKNSTSPVTLNNGSISGGGTPTTVGPKDKFRVPVAILTSNVTASSGEATLLSFRGLENTRTFGQPSAGYASGNLIIDMPDGAGLMVTTANDVARTGEEFSEDPIAPDVSTDRPEQAATEWLHSQCGQ